MLTRADRLTLSSAFFYSFERACQPHIEWLPGGGWEFLNVLLLYPSPPSSVESGNVWSETSAPQYIFMAWNVVNEAVFIVKNC
jgi:hypothetical protein